MRRILIPMLLIFAMTSCNREPYWKTQSFGRVNTLSNEDTLKIEVNIRECFYRGIENIYFHTQENRLYIACSKYAIYYYPGTDNYDTVLLWQNSPLDISHNRAILDQYKVFEYEFNNFKDSLHNCSTTNTYTIYFKGDTSSIIDMSCQFNSIYYLQQLIQENTKIEDIYSITWAQADSIFHEHYR